jgi:hypothetical protein
MTREQSRTAGPGEWIADDAGVQPGGDVAEDIQAGESYSIRYRRSDRRCAMITRTAYPAEVAGHQGVFFVQVRTEWLICSNPLDPGGTEIWSESITDDEPGIYGSAVEAEVAARQIAADLLDDGASHDWDGLPRQ